MAESMPAWPLRIVLDELYKADDMAIEDAVYHAALCYVAAGIPVIPLREGQKQLPDDGMNYTAASTNVAAVKRWFGPAGKYRGWNIGIACGGKSGVMAMDVDSKPVKGTTGLKSLEKLEDKYGPMPEGPKQETPSGGFHYLYRWQDGATSSSSKVAPGIDTRGGMATKYTGHIVVYPSRVGGKQYRWSKGGSVPPMPNWLVEALGRPWEAPSDGDADRGSVFERKEVPQEQIDRMLSALDPDDLSYEDWVKVGMSLKNIMGEDGLEVWDEWSAPGARRKENECRSRWKTFVGDGPVGLGTLSFLAKEAGWRPLPGDVLNQDSDSEIEERVLQMNKEYALVRAGKNVMMATFSRNAKNVRVGFLNIEAFYTITAPEKIWVPGAKGPTQKKMSDIWMSSPLRREYHDMGIYPQEDKIPDGMLNLWNGWAVQPDPNASCKKLLQHIRDIICSGNVDIYEWLMDWMADAVQNTRELKGSCVVLRGVEGCGKGAWADTFGSLFGNHYTHIIDSERLTSKFNSMIADSIVVFADEVLFPGDRKAANVLKGMVTERRLTKELKGIDAVEVDNLMRIIIASNEDWIIPAGPQSRRWLVLNVSPLMAKNKAYFEPLFDEINGGGKAALLHLLLQRNIKNDLRTAPETKALQEQRKMSNRHDSLLHWLIEASVRRGFDTPDASAMVGDDNKWPEKLGKFELFSEYRVYCRDARVSGYDTLSLPVWTSKITTHYGFVDEGRTLRVPRLGDLKAAFEKHTGVDNEGEIENDAA